MLTSTLQTGSEAESGPFSVAGKTIPTMWLILDPGLGKSSMKNKRVTIEISDARVRCQRCVPIATAGLVGGYSPATATAARSKGSVRGSRTRGACTMAQAVLSSSTFCSTSELRR